MKIKHKKTEFILGEDIKIADKLVDRVKGLMFIKEMKGMDGLLIKRCNSIHNCFVRFPIDVLFLNDKFKIVKVIRGFKPWRFTRVYFTANQVLELPSGTLPDSIVEGDELEVINV